MSDLAPALQEFFTRRLVSQRDASPATIAACRDTFRLLPGFAAGRARKAPSALGIAGLGAPVITAFLQHLQDDRGNSARTRNARLAAVHSFFAYPALRHPEHGALIQRVLASAGAHFIGAVSSSRSKRGHCAAASGLMRSSPTSWTNGTTAPRCTTGSLRTLRPGLARQLARRIRRASRCSGGHRQRPAARPLSSR
jgi:hypothetical protein